MLSILENLFSSILGKLGTVGVLTWGFTYANQHFLNNFFTNDQIVTGAGLAVAWLVGHGFIKGAQESIPPAVAKMLHEGTSPETAALLAKSFPQPVVLNAPPTNPNTGG